MPCMKSASAFDGGLGASLAVAAAGERTLLLVPGAPGCTIAGAGLGAGADCCGETAVAQAATATAMLNRSAEKT